MLRTRVKSILAASSIGVALAVSGCASPLPLPFERQEGSKAASTATPHAPPLQTTVPALSAASIGTTQPDMIAVLDKLQQVRRMDPAAEPRLLDELKQVPPSTWPLVAEQFRASLAYHQELVDKNRTSANDTQPIVDLRHGPPAPGVPAGVGKTLVATNTAYERTAASNDDRPSAPIGSLGDPRGSNSDRAAGLARNAPYSMPSPIGSDPVANSDSNAPAQFASDGPTYPITAQTRMATDGAAADPQAAVDPSRVVSQATAQAGETPVVKQALAEEPLGRGRAIRLPDTRGANDPNWQQSIQKAIADLEHRVSPSPTTTAEVHQHVSLRILRLLAGDTEKALEPIPHISPSEQDYWSRQIFALATYLDHHSQPDDKRRAAASVTHLDEALANLRELSSLSLRNLSFCKAVYGYGAIEPYENDTFSPGQHVLLYVEVENYHSTSSEKGFSTSLGTSYEVLDEHGKRVTSGDFPDVNDTCRSRRRDFHMQLGLTLPDNIAAGRYQLQLLVKDRQSDKIGNAKASFEVRGKK
jgi:hypothetical protein